MQIELLYMLVFFGGAFGLFWLVALVFSMPQRLKRKLGRIRGKLKKMPGFLEKSEHGEMLSENFENYLKERKFYYRFGRRVFEILYTFTIVTESSGDGDHKRKWFETYLTGKPGVEGVNLEVIRRPALVNKISSGGGLQIKGNEDGKLYVKDKSGGEVDVERIESLLATDLLDMLKKLPWNSCLLINEKMVRVVVVKFYFDPEAMVQLMRRLDDL